MCLLCSLTSGLLGETLEPKSEAVAFSSRPYNTYEASPCQVGKQVPLTTAWSVIVPHCAFVSASHSIFASTIWCSVLDSAPNTYR